MVPPDPDKRNGAAAAAVILLAAVILSMMWASRVQEDYGRVEVRNVHYFNYNAVPLRAKLFRPRAAAPGSPFPGVVYIHGYQNNRETGDAYCLELARRGFVVLNIDAIGRGNSGLPVREPDHPQFDPTYGTRSSLRYLRNLPYVDPDRTGLMGHSLGAEMAYRTALDDDRVRGLVITGFAYTEEAGPDNPPNMLMIIGQYDEYRDRMTGVDDIREEWLQTERGAKPFPVESPELGRTYGSFEKGTARRVVVPAAVHIQVSHSREAVAEAAAWMRRALDPPSDWWIEPEDQIWPLKEWLTLAALIAGLWLVMPLGRLFLSLAPFRRLMSDERHHWSAPRKLLLRAAAANGALMWLYIPLIFALFAVHIYLVRLDRAFPLMLLNAIAWWFVWINVLGFLFFRWWFKKKAPTDLTLWDLGVSDDPDRFRVDREGIVLTAVAGAALFAVIYMVEHSAESVFIIDWRFIFPFASDMTADRWELFFAYLPFFLVGFLQTGLFLHGQIRRPEKETLLGTWVYWSVVNILVLILPLLLFLSLQYAPLLAAGVIPFVGPGGMMANFTMTLFHIIGVLILVAPISTWFYLLTRRVYLGALIAALLVTWMLVSSQVAAPIPV